MPFLDLRSFDLDTCPDGLVDNKFIETHKVLPLYQRGTKVFLATTDPSDSAGLDANIHPENSRTGRSSGLTSSISKNAIVSGGSSGGVLRQWRTTIDNVPKRTRSSISASMVEIRAVTLSRPWSTTAVRSAPCRSNGDNTNRPANAIIERATALCFLSRRWPRGRRLIIRTGRATYIQWRPFISPGICLLECRSGAKNIDFRIDSPNHL